LSSALTWNDRVAHAAIMAAAAFLLNVVSSMGHIPLHVSFVKEDVTFSYFVYETYHKFGYFSIKNDSRFHNFKTMIQ